MAHLAICLKYSPGPRAIERSRTGLHRGRPRLWTQGSCRYDPLPHLIFFFLNDPPPPEIYTLPLPAPLPISVREGGNPPHRVQGGGPPRLGRGARPPHRSPHARCGGDGRRPVDPQGPRGRGLPCPVPVR